MLVMAWSPVRRINAGLVRVEAPGDYATPNSNQLRDGTLSPSVIALLKEVPAEHRDHLRTANPIESVFATVRHRTVRTKGALSPETVRLMVFKLVMAASRTWRRLKGENRLPVVVEGIRFADGVAVTAMPSQDPA